MSKPIRRLDPAPNLGRDPDVLPILMEHVPLQGRPVSLPERLEGLSHFGARGFAVQDKKPGASIWRVQRTSDPDKFHLVRWKGRGKRWARETAPWLLTWASPCVKLRVARGDRGTWLTAAEIAADPIRHRHPPPLPLSPSQRKKLAGVTVAAPKKHPASA
jgi:hypothetical protein